MAMGDGWVCTKDNYLSPDLLNTAFDCPCFEQREPTWLEKLHEHWKRLITWWQATKPR